MRSGNDMNLNVKKEVLQATITIKEEEIDKACRLMNYLGIVTDSLFGQVDVVSLYDIFTDEEKLKVLVSKLHNKAFW
jgi:hypothetical protein